MRLGETIARVLGRIEKHNEGQEELGDFTTTREVIPITMLAIGIGIFSAFVALALLRLIGIFTNLFFYQRWGTAMVSPAGNHLGWLEVFVPMAGGLIVGLMARYGSERIRGHGIPEAIEAILLKGGQIEPKVAILKPVSSAISIGSGGPFGAEGPIIMTGGAFGSMIAQFFHLTSAERRTLLVAGAAAGMSATFASPLAAVLLSVELLLFEWKPRSLIPVALASAAAAATRRYIIGMGPLFPTPSACGLHRAPGTAGLSARGAFGGRIVGTADAGGVRGGRRFRQAAHSLDVVADHRRLRRGRWWIDLPAGVGRWLRHDWSAASRPRVADHHRRHPAGEVHHLGGVTGFGNIRWRSGSAAHDGRGTGRSAERLLPNEGMGFWPLIAMGAILGGTMRSPFTGVVFAVELTHDMNVILPLLLASVVAHAFTVLTLKRSILTEKVARRGYHLSREYSVDPLEILFVREVMRSNIAAIPADTPVADLAKSLHDGHSPRRQRLYPVVDHDRKLVGVVLRNELQHLVQHGNGHGLAELIRRDPKVAYPDEPLRVVVYRMAETGLTRFPVVERTARASSWGWSHSTICSRHGHTLSMLNVVANGFCRCV